MTRRQPAPQEPGAENPDEPVVENTEPDDAEPAGPRTRKVPARGRAVDVADAEAASHWSERCWAPTDRRVP